MPKFRPPLSSNDLEAVFESMGEGCIITDIHGRIIRVNNIALKLLGYRESELIGEWLPGKVKALNVEHKSLKAVNRPIVRSLITGRPAYEYLYFHGQQRSRLPVFVSASPIMRGSRPIGSMEIFRDISMEEAVDQMKSEFISLASHQLRTPLSSIKTYSHMLLDGYMGEIDQQKRRALEIVVAAANRMNELISTLLNITRLESGAIVLQKDVVDIVEITKEIVKEMEIQAKNNSVKIVMSVTGKKPAKLRSDRPIVKEIISNLVSNSIKYSNTNGLIKIAIRSNDNSVTINVSDRGLGIPRPAQGQIFTKFFRAHNVIERETNGTGLGLYLVKGLVDQLGGKISFTSVEGQGSTFKISLPRKAASKK